MLSQMSQLVGKGWLPLPRTTSLLSLLAGLGLRPFTYCCGMIKIADWLLSIFAVLWFYVLAYLPEAVFAKYKLYTRNWHFTDESLRDMIWA